MKSHRWVLNLILITMYLGLFGFESCARDKFKESCLESVKILNNAKKKLKVSHINNISVEGEIKSTIVRFDNTKAKEYLNSKSNELDTYYVTIKGYLKKSSGNFVDSLFMLTFINDMTHWLSGKAIEDRSNYINMIRKIDKIGLSEWIMDEVFGPFMNTDDTIKEWLNMDIQRKYKDIYDFLMIAEEETGDR